MCALVGRWLEREDPEVRPIGEFCDCRVGIYFLSHHDPIHGVLQVDYVGSARRTEADVANRINAHLLVVAKRERFTSQVVIPLRPDTPVTEVRRLEGRVARAMNVPPWCRRVPGGRSSIRATVGDSKSSRRLVVGRVQSR